MKQGSNMGPGLRKGAWTAEEDNLLKNCIANHGEGKWHLIPLKAGLNRCRKSCRLRWVNYLRPNIKRGDFAEDEVDLILRLHKLLGNRWSLIAGRIPGRTANDVKNYWNTHILSRSKQRKKGPNNGGDESLQDTTMTIIKPKTQSFSKTLNIAHDSDSLRSSNNGANNINVPSNVLDDNLNNYLDDLFDDCEMEIGGNFGWSSLGGTSVEGEALNVVEQEHDETSLFANLPMDQATRDLIYSNILF